VYCVKGFILTKLLNADFFFKNIVTVGEVREAVPRFNAEVGSAGNHPEKEVFKSLEIDFYVVSSVVSFNCKSGPSEIISNGVDGVLVNDGDISALADAMMSLMKDSSIISSMSRKAIEKAGVYKVDNIMRQWISLYKSIIQ
jgi:glycosyltransferase involved in cell wall biosynthesis